MKKQILLLSFFTLALIFAGMNSSYAQSYKTNDPKGWVAPTCGDDLYHPAIGEPYDYTVAISGPGYTGGGTYAWKVVSDANLITGTDVGNTIYTVNSGAATASVNITWEAAAADGTIYYLVMEYSEQTTDAEGKACEINNMKVFPIAPINIFWLDINANIDGTLNNIAPTASTVFGVCAPDVSRAEIITPGDIDAAEVTYEYGVTTLYAEIHSEGYTGTFQAVLTVSGITGSQILATPTGWTAGTVDALGNGTYTKDMTSDIAGADEVVTLLITNNQHENLDAQPITITIDGSYVEGGITVNDMSDVNDDCSEETANADGIVETVLPRPTVTPVAPSDQFATPNPVLD